jgi:hypothetical protein
MINTNSIPMLLVYVGRGRAPDAGKAIALTNATTGQRVTSVP